MSSWFCVWRLFFFFVQNRARTSAERTGETSRWIFTSRNARVFHIYIYISFGGSICLLGLCFCYFILGVQAPFPSALYYSLFFLLTYCFPFYVYLLARDRQLRAPDMGRRPVWGWRVVRRLYIFIVTCVLFFLLFKCSVAFRTRHWQLPCAGISLSLYSLMSLTSEGFFFALFFPGAFERCWWPSVTFEYLS